MRILEAYNVLQWTIIKKMIELLEDDAEPEELNEFVIDALVTNNHLVVQAAQQEFEEASDKINEHMLSQFNVDFRPSDERLQATVDYLNRDIVRPLYSTQSRVGIAEQAYRDIVERVENSDKEYSLAMQAAILAVLGNGLLSGFVQIDGKRWRLDRTAQQISKNMYISIYNQAFEQLRNSDVELVRVFQYVNPRDACTKLQNEGIIAIKPRDVLSQEFQRYPNIWDAEHKYLEPSGHHGRHYAVTKQCEPYYLRVSS